jgi:hypothetical protein
MSDHRDGVEAAGTSPSGGPTVIDVTPAPAPEPEHAAEAPPKPRRNSVAISALVTLVLALATSPYWAQPIASVLPWGGTPEAKPKPVDLAPISAKLSVLEGRLAELAQAQQHDAALEQRVAQLEQRPAPATNPREAQQAAEQAQALTALGDRIAALEQRITALAAAASSQTAADATKALQAQAQVLSQKLDEQSQLLAKLQTREASGAESRTDVALVVTLGQLRSTLATSRPYAAELLAAEALAIGQPEILKQLQTLDARAQSGIPGVDTLRERFHSVAAQVDRVTAPPPGAGWGERLVGWTKSFFHVRRGGTGSASDLDGILATCETALGAGDLAGAVTALSRLQGPAAEAAKPWLDDAQARLDADKILATVSTALTHSISGAKP